MRVVTRLSLAALLLALAFGDGHARAAGAQSQRQGTTNSAPAAPAQQPSPAAPATPAPSATQTAPAAETPPAEGFKLDGFRSARFGMTESQVRAAIKKDFPAAGDKITVERNGTERTTALGITVDDLLPDSGQARVAYILGYKSKQLIQVNVVWGEPLAAETTTEALLTTANSLAQYFLGLGFRRESVAINTRMSDGSIVVFRGADDQNRLVLLRLVPVSRAAEKAPETPPLRALWLSYIKDAQNPDIFKIERGQF